MLWYKKLKEFYSQEQKSICNEYPELHFKMIKNKMYLMGTLEFTASYKDEVINDTYQIKIEFPEQYPELFPLVYETAGKIPPDYHRLNKEALCLGTGIEMYLQFNRDRRIVPFIKGLLIPYLYRFSFYKEKGFYPFADREHFTSGILASYKEIFRVEDPKIVQQLLIIIVKRKYRGHQLCPCGNNEKLRDCHGTILLRLFHVPIVIVGKDLFEITKYIKDGGT